MELSVNGLTESRRYLGEKKLPLHSWLSSAASGGYSEAASRCRPQVQGVCRSTSGGRRGGNGGTAYKGLKRRDGRRDTPSMCEST